MGADRIEIYTGPYAEAHASGDASAALRDCINTALEAQRLGMGVNAGHDLSQANLLEFLEAIPNVLEVSIGHALISEALYAGLEHTIHNYLGITARSGS
jgi:pyridoxine 5-phosphate synthase